MPAPADLPCAPLKDLWWCATLNLTIPDREGVCEDAPAYGSSAAFSPGACRMLCDGGRQAAACLLPDGQTLILLEFFAAAASGIRFGAEREAGMDAPRSLVASRGNGQLTALLAGLPASWAFSDPSGIFCFTKNGGMLFPQADGAGESMNLRSPWVNLDDRYALLGIYGADTFWVRRQLSADGTNRDEFHWLPSAGEDPDAAEMTDRGTALISECPVVLQHEIFQDRRLVRLECGCSRLVRAVYAQGCDGRRYIFAACFAGGTGGEEQSLLLPAGGWRCAGRWTGCSWHRHSDEGIQTIRPGECRLWMEDTDER